MEEIPAVLQIAMEHLDHLWRGNLICVVIHMAAKTHVEFLAVGRSDQADVNQASGVLLQDGIWRGQKPQASTRFNNTRRKNVKTVEIRV